MTEGEGMVLLDQLMDLHGLTLEQAKVAVALIGQPKVLEMLPRKELYDELHYDVEDEPVCAMCHEPLREAHRRDCSKAELVRLMLPSFAAEELERAWEEAQSEDIHREEERRRAMLPAWSWDHPGITVPPTPPCRHRMVYVRGTVLTDGRVARFAVVCQACDHVLQEHASPGEGNEMRVALDAHVEAWNEAHRQVEPVEQARQMGLTFMGIPVVADPGMSGGGAVNGALIVERLTRQVMEIAQSGGERPTQLLLHPLDVSELQRYATRFTATNRLTYNGEWSNEP